VRDLAQGHLLADRSDLHESRLAEVALHVVFPGVAHPAVGLHRPVGGSETRLGGHELGHVGLPATRQALVDVVVIDAPHDAERILAALGDRNVTAVLCTHAHNDHINAAADLALAAHAPVLLHAGDDVLWRTVHPEFAYLPLHDDQRIGFAGTELTVIHTPGHSPGSVCAYIPDLGALFSGDTLFADGPGATGRSCSDFPTIVRSIQDRVLTLPPETRVFTGHGDATSVGGEAPHLDEWIARGR
jgi:glyoxylase-like metal-dependent hydrolase (beta-lactamase superfamily II)